MKTDRFEFEEDLDMLFELFDFVTEFANNIKDSVIFNDAQINLKICLAIQKHLNIDDLKKLLNETNEILKNKKRGENENNKENVD